MADVGCRDQLIERSGAHFQVVDAGVCQFYFAELT